VSPLSTSFSLHRDWWRFRAPLSPGEIRRTERWLATARVALTIAAILAVWMRPRNGIVYSGWLYWLLTVYLVHGVVVMLLLRFATNLRERSGWWYTASTFSGPL